ncbi:MAG TPA: hypothetical protein PKI05_15680, partial [Thermogutta sp.]|nr:hypothetical protein [Thermogutta sp.]
MNGRHFFWTVLVATSLISQLALAQELYVGLSVVDITPSEPVALDGQRHVRIAKEAATPITATVLAMESRQGEQVLDQAVIVSCDLVAIREGVCQMVREKVVQLKSDLDPLKIFLCATHTHTAP